MNSKNHLLIFFIGLAFTVALLAACGGEPPAPPATPIPPTATPSPTPTPSPADIVREAGAAMSGLDAVRFSIERSGGRAFVDAEQQITLNSAIGIYSAPNSAAAELDVSSLGLNIKVQTIAIGAEQWLTNFLTQQWETVPGNLGFNPADIFQPDGLQSILDENVTAASESGAETIDGTELEIYAVTVEGSRVGKITAGLASSTQPVELTLWIDRSTNFIHQLALETPSNTDEVTQWLLRFGEFNEPVRIESPVQ